MITLNFMVKEEIEENDVFNRNNSHDYSELISVLVTVIVCPMYLEHMNG